MTHWIGPLAALGTACCWVGSALFFEAAGKRIGSLAVNLLRLPVAFALLCMVGAFRAQPLPLEAGPEAWGWLSLSGLVGFVFGDLCLFRALLVIGPRLSTQVMTAWPLFAALISGLWLGESLEAWQWLGIILVIAGILTALSERLPQSSRARAVGKIGAGWRRRGVLLALGGALGQAGGLVIAKRGMGEMDPFAATQIRIAAAFVGFVTLYTVFGQWSRVRQALGKTRALFHTALGAMCGPFLGVSLSLLAVQHTATGIAASLMATVPILIIPAVVLLYGERVGVRGVLGALVSVGGAAILVQ